MKFTHPEILYALFLLIIPIIIHLFNFRRFKKVYFSNLNFLKQISQQSKKTSQIRHLLILLTRLFFILFLVLAFAKPYFNDSNSATRKNSEKRIAIFIDNSFSMEQRGRNGVLLEEAKTMARELSSAFNTTDKYKLLTTDINSFDGGFVSRDDFMSDVRNTDLKPFTLMISEIINKAQNIQIIDNKPPTDIFIISDFQKSISDFASIKTDSNIKIWFLPLTSSSPNNVFIDSCWSEDPIIQKQNPIILKFKISRNIPTESSEINAKLIVNGKQKGVANINLSSQSKIESFQFMADSNSIQSGYIQIDDHPISFDDKFYFSFTVSKKQNIVLINPNENTDFIQKFYTADSNLNLKVFNENQIDFNAISTSNLLILNNVKNLTSGFISEIKKYVTNGGNIIFIPDGKNDSKTFNQFNNLFQLPSVSGYDTTKILTGKIDVKSQLFKNVFNTNTNQLPDNTNLPYFRARYRISLSANTQKEMELIDGMPLLISSKFEKGNIFVFLAAIDRNNSNLGRHALFIPIFYNMLISKSNIEKLYNLIDDEFVLISDSEPKNEKIFHIINSTLQTDFIPGIRNLNGRIQLFPEGRILNSGNYFANTSNQSIPISFNYSTTESELINFSVDELKEKIETNKITNSKILVGSDLNIKAELIATNNNNDLWKIFILLALLFLVIEVLLLRFLN